MTEPFRFRARSDPKRSVGKQPKYVHWLWRRLTERLIHHHRGTRTLLVNSEELHQDSGAFSVLCALCDEIALMYPYGCMSDYEADHHCRMWAERYHQHLEQEERCT